jgi:hypothetical protein
VAASDRLGEHRAQPPSHLASVGVGSRTLDALRAALLDDGS